MHKFYAYDDFDLDSFEFKNMSSTKKQDSLDYNLPSMMLSYN